MENPDLRGLFISLLAPVPRCSEGTQAPGSTEPCCCYASRMSSCAARSALAVGAPPQRVAIAAS